MKYIVRLARDLSEYADVEIEADSADEAEDAAIDKFDNGELSDIEWCAGADREGIYACYSEEA